MFLKLVRKNFKQKLENISHWLDETNLQVLYSATLLHFPLLSSYFVFIIFLSFQNECYQLIDFKHFSLLLPSVYSHKLR